MEIGSIYSIATLETKQHSSIRLAGESAAYFSLCREALLVIVQKYRESSKKVLLPAYTCQTVIDPFLQEGWEIEYYNISSRLRIDTVDLIAKFNSFKPALCVAHPYYGADLNEEELNALSIIKSKNCVLVEDLTQCVFSEQRSPIFDYFTGSYRKWFAIPDGSFLIGNITVDNELEENEQFIQPMSDAMYLRGVFHHTGDVNIKEVSRRIGNIAIHHISGEIVPHRMSDFSCSLLSKIDIEETKKRRYENYQYLYKSLQDNGICRPVKRGLEEITCAPLFFPIYVEERAAFQKKMAQQEIFAPILWPVHTESVLINGNINRIYSNILMLPIDQRYGVEDMQRMIDVIKS